MTITEFPITTREASATGNALMTAATPAAARAAAEAAAAADLTATQARAFDTQILDFFEDTNKYTEGSIITDRSASPVIGPAWGAARSAAALDAVSFATIKTGKAGQGLSGGTFGKTYLHNQFTTPNGNFSYGFEISTIETGLSTTAGFRIFDFNTSFKGGNIGGVDTEAIFANNTVHTNANQRGIQQINFFNVAEQDLVCINREFSATHGYPWHDSGEDQAWMLPRKRYTVIVSVIGNYLFYELVGVGTIIFYSTTGLLSANVMSDGGNVGFYFEARSGEDTSASLSTAILCHSIWAQSPMMNQMARGKASGNANTIGLYSPTKYIPTGRLLVSGEIVEEPIGNVPATPPAMAVAGQSAADSRVIGGDLFVEGSIISNSPGTSAVGGSYFGYAPLVIPSGITDAVSSGINSGVGGDGTLLHGIFRRNITFNVGDREVLEYHGRFVGSANKTLNLHLRSGDNIIVLYGGTEGTAEGNFELRLVRYKTAAATSVTFATLTINGTVSTIQRVSNGNTGFWNYQLRATTVDAGGIVLDGANHRVEKQSQVTA